MDNSDHPHVGSCLRPTPGPRVAGVLHSLGSLPPGVTHQVPFDTPVSSKSGDIGWQPCAHDRGTCCWWCCYQIFRAGRPQPPRPQPPFQARCGSAMRRWKPFYRCRSVFQITRPESKVMPFLPSSSSSSSPSLLATSTTHRSIHRLGHRLHGCHGGCHCSHKRNCRARCMIPIQIIVGGQCVAVAVDDDDALWLRRIGLLPRPQNYPSAPNLAPRRANGCLFAPVPQI